MIAAGLPGGAQAGPLWGTERGLPGDVPGGVRQEGEHRPEPSQGPSHALDSCDPLCHGGAVVRIFRMEGLRHMVSTVKAQSRAWVLDRKPTGCVWGEPSSSRAGQTSPSEGVSVHASCLDTRDPATVQTALSPLAHVEGQALPGAREVRAQRTFCEGLERGQFWLHDPVSSLFPPLTREAASTSQGRDSRAPRTLADGH